jgi:hypothetical protein
VRTNSYQIETDRKGKDVLGELKMQNVKQNDFCSCGSGKKFKKCCEKAHLPAFWNTKRPGIPKKPKISER